MPRFKSHPERRPAVITGASSGIGEATARSLASNGHPVVLGARRAERCEAIAEELCEQGSEAVGLPLDISDSASIKDFVAGAQEAVGPIEVLVCNAGYTQLGRVADTPPPDFAQQVRVNLLGSQEIVHLVAPAMISRHRGDIVFVTTDGVRAPRTGMAAYLTAKSGLEGLARIMQMELEGTGVRASIVRPGPTASEMGSDWDPEALATLFEEWSRWGIARHDCFLRPAHVAQAVADLVAMPRGSHITLVEVEPEAPGPMDLKGGGNT
jgi:NAD(P)-dependent dehydrogenase (short-subunit alcohol dehydrogenase family)